ncbi:MAG TPA: FAD-binding oxidoreductase [Acidimicrobiales bacterium]|nr:FAD-binding oxidoreductase [Acidimicrobiales bacterium]
MSPKETADVVVIGGGVTGLSTARALAELGAGQVTVLERAAIGSGGTGKSSGVVRCHYGVGSLAAMAWRSLEVLEHAPEVLGAESGFHRTGYLVAVGPENEASLRANVDMHRGLGIEVELVDPIDGPVLWPGATFDDVAATAYEPRGGYGDAHQTALAFATAARRHGASIHQQCGVAGIEVRADRVVGVRLSDGTRVATDRVVLAAGAWSVGLAADVGVDLPIAAQRAQILLVDPGRVLDPRPVLSDLVTLQYVRPDGLASLLVGDSDHTQPEWSDPDDYADRADDEFVERAITKFAHRFPGLSSAGLATSYAGCYDVTPDYNPVISPSPVEGMWICAGFSGHGYKISPAVGELAADLVCKGASRHPDIDHRDFRFERFAEGQLLTSPHPYVGAGQMR